MELKVKFDAWRSGRNTRWENPQFAHCRSLFLCTTTNSALTTTIVGCTKGVVATILGFFLFGKINLSRVGLLGVTINTIGGVMYVRAKYIESANRKRAVASA
jgi:hypothetical protein